MYLTVKLVHWWPLAVGMPPVVQVLTNLGDRLASGEPVEDLLHDVGR
jgi:hypothetical protein